MKNTNTNTATVDTITPRKAEQRKARAAAEWAYTNGTTYDDIRAAYVKPSAAKRAAWDSVKRLCASFDGYALRITGRTAQHFNAVFQYVERATGALCYCYITPTYTRHCYA